MAKEKIVYMDERIRIIEVQLSNKKKYRVFVKLRGSGHGLYLGSYDDLETAKVEGEFVV